MPASIHYAGYNFCILLGLFHVCYSCVSFHRQPNAIITSYVYPLQVIGSVSVYKKLRTKPNIFIVNLAIADFSVGAVVQGFSIIGQLNNINISTVQAVAC